MISPRIRYAFLSAIMGLCYGFFPPVLMDISIIIGTEGQLQNYFNTLYIYIHTIYATYIYYFLAYYFYSHFSQDAFKNTAFQWKLGIGNYLIINVVYAYSIFFFSEITLIYIGQPSPHLLHRFYLVSACSSVITAILESTGVYDNIRELYLLGAFTHDD